MRRLPFLSQRLPAYLWMAVIFAFSSIPQQYLPEVPIPAFSRIAHFIEYAILGALLIRAFYNSKISLFGSLIMTSIAVASLYAATDEIHQYFVPGRVMDIVDWLFDFLGSVFGAILYKLFCDTSYPQ